MLIDLEAPLKTLAGNEFKDAGEVYRLKSACVRALLTALDADKTEKNMTVEKVAKRYALAMKIQNGGEIELSPEEVAEIRERIAKTFTLEAAGSALLLLNS